MICGLGLAASGEVSGATPNDVRLAALVAEHHRFDTQIEIQQDLCDERSKADRSAGLVESAQFLAMSDRLEALHRDQGRLAHAIINQPASSFLGLAYKLTIWRREAAIARAYDFDAAHESFTFSAYQDVLRLTGLMSLAHKNDPRTALRMRTYW